MEVYILNVTQKGKKRQGGEGKKGKDDSWSLMIDASALN